MPIPRSTRLASAVALALPLLCAAHASAWTFRELMNAQGDRGEGIVQPAVNEAGLDLAFACDGDRWRQVALVSSPGKPIHLSKEGAVSLGFDREQLLSDGQWKVRTIANGTTAYFAPAPTPLMGRLYREEAKNPAAVLYVRVRPAKKRPIVLEFPVAGLRKALAEHLWKDCKLDVYFGDPK